jgi:hypothetical protein
LLAVLLVVLADILTPLVEQFEHPRFADHVVHETGERHLEHADHEVLAMSIHGYAFLRFRDVEWWAVNFSALYPNANFLDRVNNTGDENGIALTNGN